jgi:hypothetical protein
MDWTIVGTSALITLVALGAGWAWGTAYGYRKGMQGRPTLIDPISDFLKGQDEKQASKAEKAWQARIDKLRPPEVVEAELPKDVPFLYAGQKVPKGWTPAQQAQANRPGRDVAEGTRMRWAGKRAPNGWRRVRGTGIIERLKLPKATPVSDLSGKARLAKAFATPAKGKGRAATPGKPKAKARTARRPKARPGALQAARRGKLRRPRGRGE